MNGSTMNANPFAGRTISVAIADDHPLIREGVRHLLRAEPDIDVCGEAVDGASAIALVGRFHPDVVVLDLAMPDMNGITAAAEIVSRFPATRIVALSMHEESSYVRKALAAGARGYVAKRSVTEGLVKAVRAVASGGTYIDPLLSQLIAEIAADRRPDLSDREREVLMQVALGYGNNEIAAVLNISPRTVETYKARIMEKLGLRTRAEIVRYANAYGLLS
jgi:DNA-binding NarL/FixJ family response regulator